MALAKLFKAPLAGILALLVAEAQLRGEPPQKLTIFHTTDTHGCVLPCEESPGLLKLASLLRRESAKGRTLLIDCGDSFQGSFEAAFSKGACPVEAMNMIGYDAWIPGNHDYDYGRDDFLRLSARLKCVRLAANLEIDGALPPTFKRWAIFEKPGLRAAVIGMSSPHLSEWLWGSGVKGIASRQIMPSLEAILPEVMRAKPDIIVLAVHSGQFTPERLVEDASLFEIARAYPQIDIILGGHSHQEVPGERIGPSTWYVQAGAHAGKLSRIEIEYDRAARKISSLKSSLLSPDAESCDPDMQAALKEALGEASKAAAAPVAFLKEPLRPLKPKENSNALTKILCQALMEATGARIAFHGTLSERAAGPGFLDEEGLFKLVPYENAIGVLEISPSECREILEEQQAARKCKMLQSAEGLEFKTDKEGRVEGALKLADGSEWTDESKRLKAAFNGYALAGAGGRFPRLKAIAANPAARACDSGVWMRDAVRSWLSRHCPPPSGALAKKASGLESAQPESDIPPPLAKEPMEGQ